MRCPHEYTFHDGDQARCVETTDPHTWHIDENEGVWRDEYQRERWPDAPSPQQRRRAATAEENR